jgi:hypothetical protein
LKHRMNSVCGALTRPLFVAICGARKEDGAAFTPLIKYTDCPTCRRVALLRRSLGRQRNAA